MVVKDIAIVVRSMGFLVYEPVELDLVLPTACHRYVVSSELCCPSAKAAEIGTATHYTLRRNIASFGDLIFFLSFSFCDKFF